MTKCLFGALREISDDIWDTESCSFKFIYLSVVFFFLFLSLFLPQSISPPHYTIVNIWKSELEISIASLSYSPTSSNSYNVFHPHNYLMRLLDQLFAFSRWETRGQSDTHRNQAMLLISFVASRSARMEEVSSFSCLHVPHQDGLKSPLRLWAKRKLELP